MRTPRFWRRPYRRRLSAASSENAAGTARASRRVGDWLTRLVFAVTVGIVNLESGSGRGYVKVARAEAEEQTRAALLDAADEAFLSGPWEQATLDVMARAAGVTKQTLLRHFGSKEGLLEQALRRAVDAVEEQRFGVPPDDIAGAVDNLLEHYEKLGGRAMRSSNLELDGPLADLGRRARQMHYDWVELAFGGWFAASGAPQRRRLRAALITICDVQAWWVLSHDLELSRTEVRATLILTITRLLGEDR
jgi:AcrR family transcriptional regulator